MNKRIEIYMVIFFISSILTINVDAIPVEEWNKTYGGTKGDAAQDVQKTLDGGYIIAGWTWSYNYDKYKYTNYDAWLIKTDTNGNEQWNKTFDISISDRANFVQQTSDGGYMIAGSTYNITAGATRVWLIKTDNNGNEEWNKIFGTSISDLAESIQQTPDGGYAFIGYTYMDGNADAWLVKIDKDGNEQWSRTYGGYGHDYARSFQKTSDGGYILAGSTSSYGNGVQSTWLVKTDTNGNEQWNKTFGGMEINEALSVQQTIDGGYILAGSTSMYDALLIKTDVNGNEQWSKIFGKTSSDPDDRDVAYSVQQTLDNGYIFVGITSSYGYDDGSYNAWLVKTDVDGNEQWNSTYGRGVTPSFQQTSDGGYIIAGYTQYYGAGSLDAWLIKLSDNPVSDNTPPIITLNGDNPIIIHIGSIYTDPGATAIDNIDGQVPVIITGSVDTNTVGTYIITYTATDRAGNPTSMTRIVKVIYNFTGFFQPVDNLPIWNYVKAGSAIPTKFSLNSNQGLDIFTTGYPISQIVDCISSVPIDAIEETVTASSSSLSYNATTDQYSYIWKTDKTWKNTCRQLTILLKDGTYHNASFNLK